MTVTLYDSVNVAAIPADAQAVAGYVDGYGTWPQVVARFPDALLISITTTGIAGARVADVEPGAMSIPRGILWASGEVAAGRRPTLYFSISLWPQIVAAVRDATLAGRVDYWIAQWDNHPVVPAGCVAKQYTSPTAGSPGDYDLSVANLAWAEGADMSNLTPETIAAEVVRQLTAGYPLGTPDGPASFLDDLANRLVDAPKLHAAIAEAVVARVNTLTLPVGTMLTLKGTAEVSGEASP